MQKKSLTQEIIQNSIWQFSSKLINRIGALIFIIILARFLFPEDFGNYNLILSVALLFAVIAELGINETLLRYIAEAIGEKNKKRTTAYFKYIFKLKFMISSLFSIILILISWPLSFLIFRKPVLFLPLIFSSVYIFVFSFENFLSQLFYAAKKVKFIAIKDLISQSLRICFVIFIFYVVVRAFYLSGIFIGLILASSLMLLFNLFFSRKYFPNMFQKSVELAQANKKRIFKFFIYLLFGAISLVFLGYTDVIMLGILIPESAFIGYYKAAFTIVVSLVAFISFGNVILPVFTQIKKEKLEKAFNRVFRYSMILAIPSSFGLLILGKYFIRLIFGYEYLLAILPLSFLAFLIAPNVGVALYLNLFAAKEKPRAYLPLLIFLLFLNITLNYLFITILSKYSLIWGTTGAGIATLLVWIIYFFGLAFLSKKLLSIPTKMIFMIKPLIASAIMALVLWWITKNIADMTLLIGIMEILIAISIYFGIMFLLKGLYKKDVQLLIETIKNFKFR